MLRLAAVLLSMLVARPSFAAPNFFDPTFGSGGIVQISAEIIDTVAQPDGKVLTVTTVDESVAVTRYHVDGTLDATFGTGGVVLENFGAEAEGYAMILQPDGMIVVAAEVEDTGFGVARFDTDGVLDPTFGTGGRVVTGLPAHSEPFSLARQPDGKLVAAGDIGGRFGLVRYLSSR